MSRNLGAVGRNQHTPTIHDSRMRFWQSYDSLPICVPDPRDLIYQAPAATLREYNDVANLARPLQQHADPLLVDALHKIQTIKHKRETSSSIYLLTRHRLFDKARLRLVNKCKGESQHGTVQVMVQGQWQSLRP